MAFGVSNSIRSGVVRVCTPELFWQTVRQPIVGQVNASIADAWERWKRGEMEKEEFDEFKAREKKRLPIFTFHATFSGGRRKNGEAVPSGLSMYDIDHIPDPRGYFAHLVAGRTGELGIVLVHITPSGEGLRLVFVMPRGMDLAEAQRWMSRQLGDENYDQSVKDLARSSFVVPEDYILYMDEEMLFAPHPEAPVVEQPAEPQVPAGEEEKQSPPSPSPKTFKGKAYSDIIAEWFRRTGGEPVEGERNDKLHRLASHLRYITDNNEDKLLRIMPRYGLSEEEMKGLIHSACQAKWCSMPRLLREIVDKLTIDNGQLTINSQLPIVNPQLPEMPQRLPALIKLLVSQTPDIYQPAVAHAVFPSLASHLHQVRFRYIDNVEHEATLMCVLMAGTGAGKDCISEPINRIMADIRRRDAENLRREKAWKDEINSKGSNKDKRKRPEGLVIQEIDADMTNPAFVMRTAEADGHFLYTKLNEIDQFDALKGSGRANQQFQIMCLAFDPGNRYGQTRVGTQSITEKVTIRFNWNASTTIQKGKRYFSRVLTDGPVSRINFCTIPEREIGAEMPVYGTYDAAFDEALRPFIENLTRATGLIDCPEAYKLALKLNEENAEFARLSQSRVFENFSFRANVIAYLKACVLYVANGGKWDKAIEEFVRWSLRYDLWCKMEFFGADIEREMNSTTSGNNEKPGPRNLLELLPDEFTYQDAERLRQAQGLASEGTKQMLSQWKYRHYITDITDNRYQKLKYRSDGLTLKPYRKA